MKYFFLFLPFLCSAQTQTIDSGISLTISGAGTTITTVAPTVSMETYYLYSGLDSLTLEQPRNIVQLDQLELTIDFLLIGDRHEMRIFKGKACQNFTNVGDRLMDCLTFFPWSSATYFVTDKVWAFEGKGPIGRLGIIGCIR